MRVPDYLHKELIEASRAGFGDSEIVLFGSRVDDTLKGGDFDLAVMRPLSLPEFRRGKVRFFKYLLLKDLDLPIDLVLYSRANPLLRSEIQKGIRLTG